jgi:hypothetical protein
LVNQLNEPEIIVYVLLHLLYMGNAYQIKDQAAVYFLTFQVVGWGD